MTPLHLAVPLKVVTPPVPVRSYFSDLENDAVLEESLPLDSKMTPLLSRVLDDIPPPDLDNATAGRIVDSFRHTASVSDNVLPSMRPWRTLADALAKLDKVEKYVIETTDWIASSMARLTSSNTVMSGRLEEQELLSSHMASNMKEHSAHIESTTSTDG
jgi:hypothetical protein